MSKERLQILLYNAITLLEEDLRYSDNLLIELGITQEEYKEIMED